MVEGPCDKGAIHRIVIEQLRGRQTQVVIDHVALVEDQQLSGLGAKQKVLAICAAADIYAQTHPKISKQLGTLTDREWDGLTLDPVALNEQWSPPTQGANRFVTIGHSIENYHFDQQCMLGYLRFAFAEHYSDALESRISEAFPAAVALAGAVSFAAQASGCLSRLGGLIGPEHIEQRDSTLYLAPSFEQAAQVREVANPDLFLQQINTAVDVHWDGLAGVTHARWLLHGHVGSEVLWACVGFLARVGGVSMDVTQQIARGNKNERRRWWQDWLSQRTAEDRAPLDLAVSWLHSTTTTDGETSQSSPG